MHFPIRQAKRGYLLIMKDNFHRFSIQTYCEYSLESCCDVLLMSILKNVLWRNMSRVVRKPAFCVCENKDADQLHGNREADQPLCFRYIESTFPLLPKYEIQPLAILCGCTAWFMWDLVGNPEDRFSHNEAHMILIAQLRRVSRKPLQRVSDQV